MARIREANFTDSQALFRNGLLKLAFSYARLTVLSIGFQHSFGKASQDEVPFLWRVRENILRSRGGFAQSFPLTVSACSNGYRERGSERNRCA